MIPHVKCVLFLPCTAMCDDTVYALITDFITLVLQPRSSDRHGGDLRENTGHSCHKNAYSEYEVPSNMPSAKSNYTTSHTRRRKPHYSPRLKPQNLEFLPGHVCNNFCSSPDIFRQQNCAVSSNICIKWLGPLDTAASP